jgi:hypothetical protein
MRRKNFNAKLRSREGKMMQRVWLDKIFEQEQIHKNGIPRTNRTDSAGEENKTASSCALVCHRFCGAFVFESVFVWHFSLWWKNRFLFVLSCVAGNVAVSAFGIKRWLEFYCDNCLGIICGLFRFLYSRQIVDDFVTAFALLMSFSVLQRINFTSGIRPSQTGLRTA